VKKKKITLQAKHISLKLDYIIFNFEKNRFVLSLSRKKSDKIEKK